MIHIFFENEEGVTESTEMIYDGVENGEPLIAPAPAETEAVTEATEAEPLPVGEAGVTAALGYGVVFAGLAILLAVISITGAIFKSSAKKKAAKAAAEPVAEAPAAPAKLAPGTAGEIKLFDVPDKEAAMIMAIVADKLQKPLNELRFISIKEVK